MDLNTAAIIISFVVLVFLLVRKSKTSDDKALMEWLKSTNTRLDEQSRQMAEAARSIGEMSEIGKSMKDLQQFLASPKLRGGLGEQVLKQLLEESLPRQSFNLQYTFRSGVKVDAAIKTTSGIIPIDSKFTMENYKKMATAETQREREEAKKMFSKDVKDRIDEVSKKYILTDEGTVDFALMYVPSESVYYEIVNCEDGLMDYAYKRRVMPVSPSTFYAFLRSVMLSFEGQKIEARSRQVFRLLRALHKDYEKTDEVLQVLGKHLTNAYNQYAHAEKSFSLLGQKLSSSQSLSQKEEEMKTLDTDG